PGRRAPGSARPLPSGAAAPGPASRSAPPRRLSSRQAPAGNPQAPGWWKATSGTQRTRGGAVTPPAASAAPSRDVMNASWPARDDHTSDTMNVPSSASPAACESSPEGQSPWPVCMSIPRYLLTAEYSASLTPVNSRISASGIGTPCGCHLQEAPSSAPLCLGFVARRPGGSLSRGSGQRGLGGQQPGPLQRGPGLLGAALARDQVVAGRREPAQRAEVALAAGGEVLHEPEDRAPQHAEADTRRHQGQPGVPGGEQAEQDTDQQSGPHAAERARGRGPPLGQPPGHPLHQLQVGPDDVELLDREPVVGEPVDRPLGGPVVIEPGYGIPRGVDRVHRKPAVHHGDVLSSRAAPAFAGDETSIGPACARQAGAAWRCHEVAACGQAPSATG